MNFKRYPIKSSITVLYSDFLDKRKFSEITQNYVFFRKMASVNISQKLIDKDK